jgi:hypothetical protein
MDTIVLVAIVIVIVIIIAGVLYYQQYYNQPTPDINKPPGDNIRVENPDKITVLPGQKWPHPSSAGCGTNVWPNNPNGLITPACNVGTQSNLIQGGALKCSNSSYDGFTPCVQATSPY